MKIDILPLGQLQANCAIVRAEGSTSCAVIDPGGDAKILLAKLKELGLTVDAVLLTHGHFDHVGAVEEIVEATGCKLWMRESDWSLPCSPMNNFLYPIANCDFCEVNFCEEGEVIHAGGLAFRVWETPGHTWGSVCYFCEDVIFSGDTLFAGACGRTDLGGDWKVLMDSLSRFKELDGDWRIITGHGNETTLSREMRFNPYLQ